MRASIACLTLSVAVSVAASGLAVAAEPAGDAAATQASDKPDKAKKICRTIVKSGTRFGTRYCRSKEDWDRDAENAQRYLEDGQWDHSRRDGEMSGAGMAGPPR